MARAIMFPISHGHESRGRCVRQERGTIAMRYNHERLDALRRVRNVGLLAGYVEQGSGAIAGGTLERLYGNDGISWCASAVLEKQHTLVLGVRQGQCLCISLPIQISSRHLDNALRPQ